jgi:hypothetical protein
VPQLPGIIFKERCYSKLLPRKSGEESAEVEVIEVQFRLPLNGHALGVASYVTLGSDIKHGDSSLALNWANLITVVYKPIPENLYNPGDIYHCFEFV